MPYWAGNLRFESSVVSEEYQTVPIGRTVQGQFESSVVSEGYQTYMGGVATLQEFESSVVSEGYQTSQTIDSIGNRV